VRRIALAHIGRAHVRARQDCGKASRETLLDADSCARLGRRSGDTSSRNARTGPHISRGRRNHSIAPQRKAASNPSMPRRAKSLAGREAQLGHIFRATLAEAPEREALRPIAERGDSRAAADARSRIVAISCVPLRATDWPRNGPAPYYARKAISLWLTAILGDLLGCTGLGVWSFFFAAILVSSTDLPSERTAECGWRPGPTFWGLLVPTYEIGNGRTNTTAGQEYFATEARPE
jgi:hypothetical protein